MGLSENSVANDPMVLLIIIPTKWLFHWGYTPFSDIPIYMFIIYKNGPWLPSRCQPDGFWEGLSLLATQLGSRWGSTFLPEHQWLTCICMAFVCILFIYEYDMNMIWWYEYDMMIWIWHSDIPKKTYRELHRHMSSSNRAPRWHAPWSSCTFGPSWARTCRLMLVKCQWKSRQVEKTVGIFETSHQIPQISWEYNWLKSYDIPSDPMRSIIMSMKLWLSYYHVITKIERCEYPTIVIQLIRLSYYDYPTIVIL